MSDLTNHQLDKMFKDGYELGYLEGSKDLNYVAWLRLSASFLTGAVAAMGVFSMIFTGAWCP